MLSNYFVDRLQMWKMLTCFVCEWWMIDFLLHAYTHRHEKRLYRNSQYRLQCGILIAKCVSSPYIFRILTDTVLRSAWLILSAANLVDSIHLKLFCWTYLYYADVSAEPRSHRTKHWTNDRFFEVVSYMLGSHLFVIYCSFAFNRYFRFLVNLNNFLVFHEIAPTELMAFIEIDFERVKKNR